MDPQNNIGSLLSCDLVCMGVGSPAVWQGFTSWLSGRHGSQLIGYAHRPKENGMSLTVERAEFEDGTVDKDSRDLRQWKRLYSGYWVLRPSCFACPFHQLRRPGDVSIGDFLGLDSSSAMADGRGTSLVLESKSQGELALAISSGMDVETHTVAEATNDSQPMLSTSKKPAFERDKFFDRFEGEGFAAAIKVVDTEAVKRKALKVVGRNRSKTSNDADATLNASVVLSDGSTLKNRLVQRKGDCCGCSACMAACPVDAISMVQDVEGFKYPSVDLERCVNCGRCERACGYKHALADPDAVGPTDQPATFAAKHKDDAVRARSSSGGAFWALAEHVIDEGGVVYGCAFDEHLVAHHVRCETLEECKQCQGSKYSQSDMQDCFVRVQADLQAGRTVLFTGTPCQVYGLKSYLKVAGGAVAI